MQYLKFQLIKKPPPGRLLPPASLQSGSSRRGLCFICFSPRSELKYAEIFISLIMPSTPPTKRLMSLQLKQAATADVEK